MRLGAIIYTLGYGGIILALLMVLPLVQSIWLGHDVLARNFTIGLLLTAFVSGAMLLSGRSARKAAAKEIELVLIIILFWSLLPWVASLPMTAASQVVGLSEAYFETVSALTTTGGTVMQYPEIEAAPILLWRSLLGWIGGLWTLVFAVAVLAPMEVGGLSVTGSPLLQNGEQASLSERLGRPMRLIGPIYTGLTALGVIGVMAAGGGLFESFCIALSAISTTGFVTHSQGLATQFTAFAHLIISTLSLIGALSAPALVLLGVGKRMQSLGRDSELRLLAGLIIGYALLSYLILDSLGFGAALLQAISLFTTAGFNYLPNTALQAWPVFWLMLPALFGGMAFSAAGGMKMMRAIILTKGVGNEVSKLAYPSSVQSLTLDGRRLEDPSFSAIWAYTSLFLLFLAGGLIIVGLFGIGLEDGWPIVVGALTNSLSITTGLDLSVSFGQMSPYLQYFLTVLMIAGRIEILILMMLFTSSFWRFTR